MDPEAFDTTKSDLMSFQKDIIALATQMSDALAELEQSVPFRKVRVQLRIGCGGTSACARTSESDFRRQAGNDGSTLNCTDEGFSPKRSIMKGFQNAEHQMHD
ncbi:hypothetical protein [Rhizobium sp. M1]|uniref:hypothetical protein n=1 Tax=Rhizobium sp. M1 TaxID=2035453 RepID=UPI000BEE25D3|nr:hypothetical protein [Rhizobium sp. M1]PDT10204.1 hypothetical protein CO655_14595 [Rhizobium sp. M1]